MGLHVQALLDNGRQSLHAIDGHHIGEDVLVEGEANHILSASWNTVALQASQPVVMCETVHLSRCDLWL